jgi:hypothetical protein
MDSHHRVGFTRFQSVSGRKIYLLIDRSPPRSIVSSTGSSIYMLALALASSLSHSRTEVEERHKTLKFFRPAHERRHGRTDALIFTSPAHSDYKHYTGIYSWPKHMRTHARFYPRRS